MPVISISGIRGIVNQDVSSVELAEYVERFAAVRPSKDFLIGRDTRASGEIIRRTVCATLIATGAKVIDYGVISTPALFRESRLENASAVMISASHNQPEWNGIKFITNGRGISEAELGLITSSKEPKKDYAHPGTLTQRHRSRYNSELIGMAGKGSADGVTVAIDLNGGAAITHAAPILEGIGCKVRIIGGTPGMFYRTVDPTSDSLEILTQIVKNEELDVGFAFDCDGDRLVLVDDEGVKRSGDFMLALALKRLLPTSDNRSVVVTVDTSQAVDDVVSQQVGTVYRSKVGEANVVSTMIEKNIRFGGEGSSGGIIDGSYNFCRDSMIGISAIVKAIEKTGKRVFREVPSYEQVRLKVPLERKKASAVIKKLQKDYPDGDASDGIKLKTSHRSWVLIRASGTEDLVRVSAESKSAKEAQEIANSFLDKVKRLARSE